MIPFVSCPSNLYLGLQCPAGADKGKFSRPKSICFYDIGIRNYTFMNEKNPNAFPQTIMTKT
jgi:hypothetical protein